MQDNKNFLLATILSVIVLIGWSWLYEKPKAERAALRRAEISKSTVQPSTQDQGNTGQTDSRSPKPYTEKALKANQPVETILTLKSREDVLSQSKNERIKIKSDSLHGSISLKGARFDDLTLAQYFVTSKHEEEVKLFSPSQSKERYFADFGWISSDSSLELPKPNTLWKSKGGELTPNNPITLHWANKSNIEFLIKISLDKDYMFNISQSVKNNSNKDISIAPYGRVNRTLNTLAQANYILHEGAIGNFEDILYETSYKDLVEEKEQIFEGKDGGWLGITDKYWLSSIIPDKKLTYKANFSNHTANHNSIFNTEFVGQEIRVPRNETLNFDHHLFAGAKKVSLLDKYSEEYDIHLFDRAVDFGWFYFLTKPFFFIVSFLNQLLGNFGFAILAMTVIIKLILFPMANKSYTAIGKVKKLQPKVAAIKEKFKEDRVAFNRELMALYKKEKVSPASGCLPVLVQIPVFFALYKVLFVTLDMRQATFYGWIHDLSAPDPTSIFNLFGLLPFEVSSTFAIGAWPIMMGITMMLQQKLSPASADPTQAKILKFMPFVLTFVLAAFPAGLVIYWTWSNTLSILQQWIITNKLNKEK